MAHPQQRWSKTNKACRENCNLSLNSIPKSTENREVAKSVSARDDTDFLGETSRKLSPKRAPSINRSNSPWHRYRLASVSAPVSFPRKSRWFNALFWQIVIAISKRTGPDNALDGALDKLINEKSTDRKSSYINNSVINLMYWALYITRTGGPYTARIS